jgi:hypothetical protein
MPEKRKQGRPFGGKKFKNAEEMKRKMSGFFEWCENNDYIPDIECLAVYTGISRRSLINYENQDEFRDLVLGIKDEIFFRKKQLAMRGKIPPAIFIFDAKNNHGYRDTQEIEQTIGNKDGKPFLMIGQMTDAELNKRLLELDDNESLLLGDGEDD